jgi:hypothetical protein
MRTRRASKLLLHFEKSLQVAGAGRFEHGQIGFIDAKETQRSDEIAESKTGVRIDLYSVVLKALLIERTDVAVVQDNPIGDIQAPFFSRIEPICDFRGTISCTSTHASWRQFKHFQAHQ